MYPLNGLLKNIVELYSHTSLESCLSFGEEYRPVKLTTRVFGASPTPWHRPYIIWFYNFQRHSRALVAVVFYSNNAGAKQSYLHGDGLLCICIWPTSWVLRHLRWTTWCAYCKWFIDCRSKRLQGIRQLRTTFCSKRYWFFHQIEMTNI